MSAITQAQIKHIRSLHSKKFRDSLGEFIVEGEKMVAEAIDSDFEVLGVYRRDEIGDETMSRISLLDSPSPVLAVLKKKEYRTPSLSQGLCLGLDAVRDPGNLGTIIRIADWFGISTVYCSNDCADLYNPKTVQATMGAIFRKDIVYCDLKQICRMFAADGRKVYGTFLGGRNIYTEDLDADSLVIMGNEANGISKEVSSLVSDSLTIPSFGGKAESLNVAVATAVTVSEFRRR